MNYSDQTLKELGSLLLKLRSHPKTSKTVAKAITQIAPNVRFPDLEQDRLRGYVDKRFEELQLEREREQAEQRLAEQRKKVMLSFGDDPKEQERHIAGVEEIMRKYNLFDYEAAAKIYAASASSPAAKPEPMPGAPWEAPKIKEMFENPNAYARKLAFEYFTERDARRSAL